MTYSHGTKDGWTSLFEEYEANEGRLGADIFYMLDFDDAEQLVQDMISQMED